MRSQFSGPLNVGSDEMVTINQLVRLVTEIAGKKVTVVHKDGPLGVRGRNSDNRLIKEKLGWSPSQSLRIGLEQTYQWVEQQVHGLNTIVVPAASFPGSKPRWFVRGW
jgi:GDP-D-mannose 3',5'-epimerase